MVITKLTKAGLCAQWSPNAAKFALGSGAKAVSVGFYDPESKWWACKLIRKPHNSSITTLAWHPSSAILATGSTDCKCRLFNAYLEGFEPADAAGSVPAGTSFGECLLELSHEGCGWVHSVVWAPGDSALTYASHDGVVGTIRGQQQQADDIVRLSGLPLKVLLPVSERLLVGAGWEGRLVVLTRQGPQQPWKQAAVLNDSSAASPSGPQPGLVKQMAQLGFSPGGAAAAGQASASGGGASAAGGSPAHSNCVTQLKLLALESGRGRARAVVMSAGLDGRLLCWDVSNYL